MRHIRFLTLAAGALAALVASGCSDEEELLRGDYANCGSAVLPEQEAVCDDLLTGVVRLCGFDLTVEPCPCVGEVEGCAADSAWIASITDCREGASDCAGYVACLESVGTSPSGCTSPATWVCIASAADTEGE